MPFTEKEMREQAYLALKEEFSRLDEQLAEMINDAGLSEEDLEKTLAEKLPPDVEKALAQAKEEAAQAGRARAAAQAELQRAPARRAAGRGRPGAVKL